MKETLQTRTQAALAKDLSLCVQTQPVQQRDAASTLTLSVSADVSVIYRIVDTRKFALRYASLTAFQAAFAERLKAAASAALAEILSGEDRGSYVKKSQALSDRIRAKLKPFLRQAGVFCRHCDCVPQSESARADELEATMAAFRGLEGIDPALAILVALGLGGASLTGYGMSPILNTMLGKALSPTPSVSKPKDNDLIETSAC